MVCVARLGYFYFQVHPIVICPLATVSLSRNLSIVLLEQYLWIDGVFL